MKYFYSLIKFSPTFLALCLLPFKQAHAVDCGAGQVEVNVVIDPDDFESETSWEIRNADGAVVYNGDWHSEDVCLDTATCYSFYLYDSYGDGIYAPHGVELYYAGALIAELGGVFSVLTYDIGCPPGHSCGSAETITAGTYTAPEPNYWYAFTPDVTGTYTVSTCDLGNTCNTKIWVYDHCLGLIPTEYAEGTYAYNDDQCGEQSALNTILVEGETYYIRIGDSGASCAGSEINWSLAFAGIAAGCTDIYACNYDPLAVENDGSCLYPGDAGCPSGPDLIIDASYFDNLGDFTVAVQNADDPYGSCLLAEGAFTGTGSRKVLEFSIKIMNIGDEDYHIGSPGEAPWLVFDPCHGHYHYVDYGIYTLYDSLGNEIPAGHKNGFAVMDVGCFAGEGGYGGGDMGISAGCYDMYGAGTSGQWVDITDVPSGTYSLVARVNPYNHEDVDGRTETNLANNWVQACITIHHTAGGAPYITMSEDCLPFYDCYGEIFGTAKIDCNGNCGGSALVGDLDGDTSRTYTDVGLYTNKILSNTIIAGSCNDANSDGDIDAYDASLVLGCAREGMGFPHIVSVCELPAGITITDTVTFSIGSVNPEFNYLDIFSLNPTSKVLSYQFDMSGLIIDSVINLAAETFGYDFTITHSHNEIIGLAYGEIPYQKRLEPIPILRIFYHVDASPTTICINHFTTAVNENYQEMKTAITDECVTVDGLNDVTFNPNLLNVTIKPNPFTDYTTITFSNYANKEFTLQVADMAGNIVRTYTSLFGHSVQVDRKELPAGLYLYKLTGGDQSQQGKFIIQ